MANENTTRRGLYLPHELDNWFIDHSDETNKKINAIMLDALNEYKDNNSKTKRQKDKEFAQKVYKVISAYNDECGITGHGADK